MKQPTQERITSLLRLASKSPSELLVHVYELQDQIEELTKSCNDATLALEASVKNIPALIPVKGKDFYTEEEAEELLSNVLKRVPPAEKVDIKKLHEGILSELRKQFKAPKDGKDALIDYDRIVQDVLDVIELPKNGADGKPGENGSPDTPEQIMEKINSITPEMIAERPDLRFDKHMIPGLEKFSTQMELDYAISKLRNQVSFLINKVEDIATNGGGGGGGGGSLTGETPTGAIDGVNTDFVVTNTPVQFFWNGQYQNPNAGDYTYDSGTKTITMAVAPSSGDNLVSFYI